MKLIAVIMVLLLVGTGAFAEEPTRDFLGLGDSGKNLTDIFALIGCLRYDSDEDGIETVTDATIEYLIQYQMEHGLTESGLFDPETMYFACGIPTTEQSVDSLVWVPMFGGVKYHTTWKCSNMIEPRQMPLECAEYLGFSKCMRCYD